MKNNFTDYDVGLRIRQGRKEMKLEGKSLTLDEFGESCGRTRQLVSKWEHGDLSSLEFKDLDTLCDLFQCDIGYLFGECDTKRHVTADIQRETGLSVKAIEKIANMNRYGTIPVEILSKILEHPDIEALLHKIYEFAWTESACNQLKNMENRAKIQGLTAQGIVADRAKQDAEEIRDSKEFRVTKVFGKIFDAVVDVLVRESTDIQIMGTDMMEKVLHPEEQRKNKQIINEMTEEIFANKE